MKTTLNILKIKLKANKAKVISGAVLCIVAASSCLSLFPLGTYADSSGYNNYGTQNPQFNIFTPYSHTQAYNQDYFLIDAKNDTKGSSFNNPVYADAGDVLTFSIYYHNGINGSTAYNTHLRVSLPDQAGTQLVANGYLWADNADNAMPNNPISGSETINLSSEQGLQYIPGSAEWYPNQADSRYDAPAIFPYGQTSDEIVGNGINIGDVQGCWEYSGYVNFRVRVTSIIPVPQNPCLAIQKTLSNLTEGQTSFYDSIATQPKQRVAVKIDVASTGGAPAINVITHDSLPDRLIYVPGTTRVNGAYASDGIIGQGINIGTLAPGQTATITFEAVLEKEALFPRGETTLVNTGQAVAENFHRIEDSATIIVNYTGCSNQNNRPSGR